MVHFDFKLQKRNKSNGPCDRNDCNAATYNDAFIRSSNYKRLLHFDLIVNIWMGIHIFRIANRLRHQTRLRGSKVWFYSGIPNFFAYRSTFNISVSIRVVLEFGKFNQFWSSFESRIRFDLIRSKKLFNFYFVYFIAIFCWLLHKLAMNECFHTYTVLSDRLLASSYL